MHTNTHTNLNQYTHKHSLTHTDIVTHDTLTFSLGHTSTEEQQQTQAPIRRDLSITAAELRDCTSKIVNT